MGDKFEKLKSDLKTQDASGVENTFHQDNLYLKDNTLINREEHVEFMKTQFFATMATQIDAPRVNVKVMHNLTPQSCHENLPRLVLYLLKV